MVYVLYLIRVDIIILSHHMTLYNYANFLCISNDKHSC